MKREQILWAIILLFVTLSSVSAQSNYYLKIVNNENSFTDNKKEIYSIQDSASVEEFLREWIEKKRRSGFITTTLDSVTCQNDSIYAFISTGKRYTWLKLKKGNVDDRLLKLTGYKEKLYADKPFSLSDYNKMRSKLISFAENRGNPFASVKLDSIIIIDSRIQASLNYRSGPPVFFDSVSVVGTAKAKPKFIAQYYNIKKGDKFNRAKISEVERSISQFPTIKAVRTTDIIYSNYKAYPVFFLDHREANIIDGIVGFLPNENRNGKLLITGQLHLNLYNMGGSGRDLLVEWNKLKPLSQSLNLGFNNYNFFRTGLDLESSFNLLKEDTTFINITGRLNISKSLPKNYGKIKFFTELKNSRIGGGAIEEQARDSVFADFNLTSYGLGYQWLKLDDVIFPRKGFKVTIDGLIGNKKVKGNPESDSIFNRNSQTNSLQSAFTAALQVHWKVKGKSGLYAALSGGFLFNNQLFTNDMFRIGGLKTLRGFNENYFFASKYSLSNIEFRYFYEPESYLMLFYDQAYINSEVMKRNITDYPLGIGAGINLKTPVGSLQVIYSVGKSNEQPLRLNYSKIHFGITNRF